MGNACKPSQKDVDKLNQAYVTKVTALEKRNESLADGCLRLREMSERLEEVRIRREKIQATNRMLKDRLREQSQFHGGLSRQSTSRYSSPSRLSTTGSSFSVTTASQTDPGDPHLALTAQRTASLPASISPSASVATTASPLYIESTWMLCSPPSIPGDGTAAASTVLSLQTLRSEQSAEGRVLAGRRQSSAEFSAANATRKHPWIHSLSSPPYGVEQWPGSLQGTTSSATSEPPVAHTEPYGIGSYRPPELLEAPETISRRGGGVGRIALRQSYNSLGTTRSAAENSWRTVGSGAATTAHGLLGSDESGAGEIGAKDSKRSTCGTVKMPQGEARRRNVAGVEQFSDDEDGVSGDDCEASAISSTPNSEPCSSLNCMRLRNTGRQRARRHLNDGRFDVEDGRGEEGSGLGTPDRYYLGGEVHQVLRKPAEAQKFGHQTQRDDSEGSRCGVRLINGVVSRSQGNLNDHPAAKIDDKTFYGKPRPPSPPAAFVAAARRLPRQRLAAAVGLIPAMSLPVRSETAAEKAEQKRQRRAVRELLQPQLQPGGVINTLTVRKVAAG